MSDELLLEEITEQARAYGKCGMHVFPVHAETKSPMYGYGWAVEATKDDAEIVQDFTLAIMQWGADNVSIAWALGLDDCMAVDFDTPQDQEPPWAAEIEPQAMINPTRQGRHMVFKNPDGLIPGNGVSHFPTKGGFDVRGAGGYIVIGGPDRPGFDAAQLAYAKSYPHPEHLTPYGGHTTAATKQELQDFLNKHTASKGPQYLNWLPVAIETQWIPGNEGDARSGRHPLACEWMAKVAEEAQLGLYSFRDGATLVHNWFKTVKPEATAREWVGIMSWAVGRALSHPPTDGAVETEPHALDEGITPFIDWSEFWTDDQGEHEWLIEGFWPKGRSVLLHAPAKTGKSLYSLWCAVCLALGIDLATGEQFEPTTVMYVDYEMSPADLQERLNDFGVSPNTDLSRLYYSQTPMDFTSLDTFAGAAIALSWVDRVQPGAIVLDTFSRCVDGDENEADTVRAFYRHTGRPLRDRGIPYLRVDHTGKDSSKGARGSSAKADDVDLIWSMQQTQSGFQLKSRSRVSWVPGVLNVDRTVTADQITFSRSAEITELVMDEATTTKVYEMEELGIDPSLGRDAVMRLMLEAGRKPGRAAILSAAIRWRKDAAARGVVIGRPRGWEGLTDSDS